MTYIGLIQPQQPLTQPRKYELTPEGRKFLEEQLQAQYLSRFIKYPPQDLTPPGPFPDTGPETFARFDDARKSLMGELLIHALGDGGHGAGGDPDPQPNRITIVNQIKKEGLDVKVLQGLIEDLEGGLDYLKNELSAIKR